MNECARMTSESNIRANPQKGEHTGFFLIFTSTTIEIKSYL